MILSVKECRRGRRKDDVRWWCLGKIGGSFVEKELDGEEVAEEA